MKENGHKNKDSKEQRGDACSSGSVRAKWFCCVFKFGFLQLICRASLIFKSNFGFAYQLF